MKSVPSNSSSTDPVRLQFEMELDRSLTARLNDTSYTIYDELAQQLNLSRTKVKDAAKKGALWLSRAGSKPRRVRRQQTASVGDCYFLNYDSGVLAQTCKPPLLVEDCEAYSVWDKPSGMLSQPSKWSDHTSLCRAVEQSLGGNRPAYLVHRLDKMTSGLIIVSHEKSATVALARAFQDREVKKTYQCITQGGSFGELPQNITTLLDGKPAQTTILEVERPENWLQNHGKSSNKGAKSDERLKNCRLVTVEIGTGRKHQIRRHLASINAFIVGDRRNRGPGSDLFDDCDLQLRSVQLSLECPVTQQKKIWKL